jgi:formamidopyrimidine-DNA glycosylase
MTGQMVLRAPSTKSFAGGHPTKSGADEAILPDNSTRVIFHFDGDKILYFNDQRKFGWIKLLPTKEVHSDHFIRSIGPEPDDEESFTPTYLWRKVKNRITPIKAILLDQSIVAGIGNIYADEALHLAKIHPARKASSLSKGEVAALFNAIIVVLKNGIEKGGTSFTNYVNAVGQKGDYLNIARVFRREGQTCGECGDTIIKTKVAGRGTHYCPTCQVPPKISS